MYRYRTEQLKEILLRIDEEAALLLGKINPKCKVVIVGGSAFMLSNLTKRPATHDIDVLNADTRVASILKNYRMVNRDVLTHSDEIPYNFEDRLRVIKLPTETIEFVTPSLEDLVVMKLYAWRPNDIEDLTSPNVLNSIDWKLLEHLVYSDDEAKASCQSDRRYQELLFTYQRYVEEYARHEADV